MVVPLAIEKSYCTCTMFERKCILFFNKMSPKCRANQINRHTVIYVFSYANINICSMYKVICEQELGTNYVISLFIR